jgi:hypothetical protein
VSNWVPVATGLLGAGVAAAGFFLNSLRGSRETLDKRIERAAKSQIGDRFMDFLEVGERARREMATLTSETLGQAQAVIADAQSRLKQLEASQAVEAQLEALIARAELVIPELSTIEAASPVALGQQLDTAQLEPPRAAAIISRLKSHPSANARQLEKAGDVAREVLEDVPLARELYGLASERDPQNVSIRAELLAIDLTRDDATAANARDELQTLAVRNPTVRNPLIKLLNDFVEREDYKTMENLIRQLLEQFPNDPLLLRNLALALSHVSDDVHAIDDTYRQSLQYADKPDGESDFVNAARPYANWLIYQGRLEEAERVLRQAWQKRPMEDSLFLTWYRLEMARGDIPRARRALDVMGRLGGVQEEFIARKFQAGLDAMTYLESGTAESLGDASREVDPGLLQALATLWGGHERDLSEPKAETNSEE